MNNEQLPPILNLDDLSVMVGEDEEDDLDLQALIDKQQRGPVPKSTKIILSVMALAIMFFAGSFVQQHFGQSSSVAGGFGAGSFAGLRGPGGGAGLGGSAGLGGAGSFPGLGGPGGGASAATPDSAGGVGGFTPAGITAGTITLVDGTHVYVTDATGAIIKVNVSEKTSITVSNKATVAQLKTGQQVLVRGDAAADGTVAATSVTQGSLPSGAGLTRNGN